MNISLVGMSNIGKSKLSKRLTAEHGYRRIDIDGLIEARMDKQLADFGTGLAAMAQWLGTPFDAHYAKRSQQYLALEEEILDEALDNLDERPTIIDTTGSVVHLSAAVIEKLQKVTCAVYLEAGMTHIDKLLAKYIEKPKPVIWWNPFIKGAGDTVEAVLQHNYRTMLTKRAERYAALAEITIPHERHWDMKGSLGFFFEALKV